jgi:hypothetical protein
MAFVILNYYRVSLLAQVAPASEGGLVGKTVRYQQVRANDACLHRRNGGGGARVCSKGWERKQLALYIRFISTLPSHDEIEIWGTYGRLDILARTTSRQMGGADHGAGLRDDIRTVDQLHSVLAKGCELRHNNLEVISHISFLAHVGLPEAGGSRIYPSKCSGSHK